MMQEEYLKRWRLILGGDEADGTGVSLSKEEIRMDECLEAVYDSDRSAGLGSSAPKVSRWLGDIREFFPQSVVQVIQRDAVSRLHLHELLTEPEMLEGVVPDVHLVATLMSLSRAIPEKSKATAREIVRKVVDELLRKARWTYPAGGHGGTQQVLPTSQSSLQRDRLEYYDHEEPQELPTRL